MGITTQAISDQTIRKSSRGFEQLASNVCLKINAKLGGKNFKISPRTQ